MTLTCPPITGPVAVKTDAVTLAKREDPAFALICDAMAESAAPEDELEAETDPTADMVVPPPVPDLPISPPPKTGTLPDGLADGAVAAATKTPPLASGDRAVLPPDQARSATGANATLPVSATLPLPAPEPALAAAGGQTAADSGDGGDGAAAVIRGHGPALAPRSAESLSAEQRIRSAHPPPDSASVSTGAELPEKVEITPPLPPVLPTDAHRPPIAPQAQTAPSAAPPAPGTAAPVAMPIPEQILREMPRDLAIGQVMELSLAPKELGRIRLEIRQGSDGAKIILTAERPETMELVKHHVPDLIAEFRQAGLPPASVSFGDWASQTSATPHNGEGRSQGPPPQGREVETRQGASESAAEMADSVPYPPHPHHQGRMILRL